MFTGIFRQGLPSISYCGSLQNTNNTPLATERMVVPPSVQVIQETHQVTRWQQAFKPRNVHTSLSHTGSDGLDKM